MNISDFLAQIDSTPSDYPFILSVFADWLEEKGDSRSIGVRWLSSKKIIICKTFDDWDEEPGTFILWIGNIGRRHPKLVYRWWSQISHIGPKHTGVELFRNLSLIGNIPNDCVEYPSISSAFLDLANSYIKTIQDNPNFR